MDENTPIESLPPSQRAHIFHQKGMELKKAGSLETALTEFRRAVLADPAHFESHLEIGRLCRLRGQGDPTFYRYAFEAFRSAARLNLTHQEAHDGYIMMAQKMGRLDDLLAEYENLEKFNPDNELIKRCKKNIITITMALIPDKVNISPAKASAGIKRATFMGSMGSLVVGLAMVIIAPIFLRGTFLAVAIKPMMNMGIMMTITGAIGLIVYSQIKN